MMNATSNNTDLITTTVGSEKRGNMYAYQTGALESVLKYWIGTCNAPGLHRLSSKDHRALREFITEQISKIEADAKRSAGL